MHNRILRAMKDTLLNRAVPLLILAVLTVVGVANGQQRSAQPRKLLSPEDPSDVPIAISDVEKGNVGPIDLQIIARWHAVQAIPSLETQFEQSKDPVIKPRIANTLVRLGVKQGPYWDFLVDQAIRTLQDVPPTPFGTDASGKAIVGKPSKRFVEWANQHHMSLEQALDAMGDAMGAVINLGSSGDDRAIPYLREALASESYFVEVEAARGLAALHDTASVPAIISACENAPKEAAAQIAESLVYFDDPTAQRAVDAYVPKSRAQELRKGRAQGGTPYDPR